MRRAVSGSVLLVLLVCAAGSAGPAHAAPLTVAVVSVEPSSFGATVRWRTSRPASVVVEYGLTEDYGVWSRRVAAGPSGAGRSALTSLEPGQVYRFRLVARSGDDRALADGSFATRSWPIWVGATTTARALLVGGQPFFPRMVWEQCPWAYPLSLSAGINVFMGTGCGSIGAQAAGLQGRALSILSVDDRPREIPGTIGFHQADEADEHVARPEDLPLLPASRATRRVPFLTLTNHFFSGAAPLPQGRGMYPALIARAEMVGFNLYPLQIWCRRETLHTVYEAQRELVALAPDKPTYQWIEAAPMSQCWGLDPSPAIVRAETWLAIAGGARGVGWFPDIWSEQVRAEIARLSREIVSLAPALLGEEGAPAVISPPDSPVRAGIRRWNGATYVIAVNSWIEPAKVRIRVPGLSAPSVCVLGEKRMLRVRDGTIVDSFRGLRVRVYVVPPS